MTQFPTAAGDRVRNIFAPLTTGTVTEIVDDQQVLVAWDAGTPTLTDRADLGRIIFS